MPCVCLVFGYNREYSLCMHVLSMRCGVRALTGESRRGGVARGYR